MPNGKQTPAMNWLSRMNKIADELVKMGRRVLGAGKPKGGGINAYQMKGVYVDSVLLAVTGSDRMLGQIGDEIANTVNAALLHSSLGKIVPFMESTYGEQSGYLKYVMAARAYFESAQTLSASINSAGHKDDSFSWKIGVKAPKISVSEFAPKLTRTLAAAADLIDAASDVSGSVANTTAYDLSGHVQLILVPLVELCDIVIERFKPVHFPGIHDAVELFNHGIYNQAEFNGMVRYAGGVPDLWMDVARARAEKLPWHDLIQYARRTGKNDTWIHDALIDRGVSETDQRIMMAELYWEVPTINDHLHWLQRNVFDDHYVQQYNLMDGFEERFWTKFGRDLTVLGMRKENAALHYAAHWIQPAPTQMLEFLYRLRPDKVGQGKSFTIEDFKRLLMEQDYAPLARQWFADTAYRVPALGYIRDMYRLDVINDQDLVGYHQDLGYTEQDSKRFLGVDKWVKARWRASQSAGWTPQAVGRAVALGSISVDRAVEIMSPMGYSNEEIKSTIEVANTRIQQSIMVRVRSRTITQSISIIRNSVILGVFDLRQAVAAYNGLGLSDVYSVGLANLDVAAGNAQRVGRILRQLKGAYHRGEIDRGYAQTMLTTIGITATAVAQYLSEWDLENTPGRKRRTATAIIRDIVEHGMAEAEATARLRNLGYSDADIRLFIADAKLKLNTDASALVAAQELRGLNGVKELLQLHKSSGGLNKRIIREIEKQASPANIKRWLEYTIMSEEDARRFLTLYGWEQQLIDKLIEESRYAREKVKTNPPPVPLPAKDGGGSGG